MNRRSVLSLAGAAAVGMAVPDIAFAQSATPAAGAIQTQIANLQATLTAMANTPVSSPSVASPVFEFTGTGSYVFRHHVEIRSIAYLRANLQDPITGSEIFPHGIFVAIALQFTNLGSDPVAGWDDYDLRLRDDTGRAFSIDHDASFALAEQRGVFVSIFQPSLPYDQIIVFDVATDAKNFVLGVKDTSISVSLGNPH